MATKYITRSYLITQFNNFLNNYLTPRFIKKDGTKGLSSNDFSDSDKAKLDMLHNYDDTQILERVSDTEDSVTEITEDLEVLELDVSLKVNMIEGKGLSSNDFTDELKNKLDQLQLYDDSVITEHITSLNSKVTKNEQDISLNTNKQIKSIVFTDENKLVFTFKDNTQFDVDLSSIEQVIINKTQSLNDDDFTEILTGV